MKSLFYSKNPKKTVLIPKSSKLEIISKLLGLFKKSETQGFELSKQLQIIKDNIENFHTIEQKFSFVCSTVQQASKLNALMRDKETSSLYNKFNEYQKGRCSKEKVMNAIDIYYTAALMNAQTTNLLEI